MILVLSVKEEAIRIINDLPEEINWDDIIYEFYIRKKIELGLEAIEKGDVYSHDQIKKEFL